MSLAAGAITGVLLWRAVGIGGAVIVVVAAILGGLFGVYGRCSEGPALVWRRPAIDF